MKGFSPRHLKYMRAFAEAWPDRRMVQQVVARLPWGGPQRPAPRPPRRARRAPMVRTQSHRVRLVARRSDRTNRDGAAYARRQGDHELQDDAPIAAVGSRPARCRAAQERCDLEEDLAMPSATTTASTSLEDPNGFRTDDDDRRSAHIRALLLAPRSGGAVGRARDGGTNASSGRLCGWQRSASGSRCCRGPLRRRDIVRLRLEQRRGATMTAAKSHRVEARSVVSIRRRS